MPRLCLLDPSITSREGLPPGNLGDLIIREAVIRELNELFPRWDFISIPTQLALAPHELELAVGSDLLIVGGTNLLSSHMQQYRQWQISPSEAAALQRVVVIGAGWWQYQESPDEYTQSILRAALSPSLPQSVRDSYTKQKLQGIGLQNVINTGCPTMWRLNAKQLSNIPTTKAEDVLITLTDYNKDRDADWKLLDLLLSQYKQVYLWPQGSQDAQYLTAFGRSVTVLDRSMPALEQLLSRREPLDYIGTRLHCGIKCLQHSRRSLVLSIDNRAAEIAADTALPVVPRNDLEPVKSWIAGSQPVQLRIDEMAIARWKLELAAGLIEGIHKRNPGFQPVRAA